MSNYHTTISRTTWTERSQAHKERVEHLTKRRVHLASRQKKDPIFDFLYDYYSFRPACVERWTPGSGVLLEDAHCDTIDWGDDFVQVPEGAFIPTSSFPSHRIRYLEWAVRYLERTLERSPLFSCFGLHEWAMLYRAPERRHISVPLRITQSEIDSVVEQSDIRCTHYDAFRFFTADAVPLNRHKLTREDTIDFDQPGCLHVHMDLYRFAIKVTPFLASEILADAFLLAAETRILDMRATPYDFTEYGYSPIKIESVEGRAQYVAMQRELYEKSKPVRERLLNGYRALLIETQRFSCRN